MRLRNTLLIGFAGLTVGAAAVGGDVIESTFDSDAEGWAVLNDATGFTWTDEFGNPGGSIRAEDEGTGTWWYFSAPEAYLGDKSAFFGGELSWQIYGITGSPNDAARADVMLVGADMVIGCLVPVIRTEGEWTSWSVTLDDSTNWQDILSTSTGSLFGAVDPSELAMVLSDLQAVYIRGEFTTGPDASALDNVRMVPGVPCGDVNDDGFVNLADLNEVLAYFGTDFFEGDANNDGTVNLADLNLVLAQFGGSC